MNVPGNLFDCPSGYFYSEFPYFISQYIWFNISVFTSWKLLLPITNTLIDHYNYLINLYFSFLYSSIVYKPSLYSCSNYFNYISIRLVISSSLFTKTSLHLLSSIVTVYLMFLIKCLSLSWLFKSKSKNSDGVYKKNSVFLLLFNLVPKLLCLMSSLISVSVSLSAGNINTGSSINDYSY